jgi:glycerol-3-phosphate dehydrogenase
MNFSALNRKEFVSKLTSQVYDVLIIGGGITGAGIALDAASRGMKTALVEMQDFSAGTSSRSTKLVHGGLRYLKQLQINMVAEVGKEREIVYENGPHVTTPERMLLPIYRDGTFGRISTGMGLSLYDYLAGVKKSERKKMLTREEVLQLEPLVRKEGLLGGGYYVEYRTDDARLTIEVIKAAFEHGAVPLNYTKVEELLYKDNQINGVSVRDQLSGELYVIQARKVVNAAGPWVDSIRSLDSSKKGKFLKLSKGVHVVMDQSRFPLKQAIYFDTPDGRMLFAIPRGKKTYVGTTDTFYENDVTNPSITDEDITYLLQAINYMFPEISMTKHDIESCWAGVRPLIYEEGKKASEISRKDEIWESDSGLITIAGGKLTGYRKMAETTVNLLAGRLSEVSNRKYLPCRTKKMAISGGKVGGAVNFEHFLSNHTRKANAFGLNSEQTYDLGRTYGSNITKLLDLVPVALPLSQTYHLPLETAVKLLYGIHYEMIVTPLDYFYRRTGDLLFQINQVKKYKNEVISIMNKIFLWDKKREDEYMDQLELAISMADINNQF